MADQPRRPRTLGDARSEAEAAFKKVTAKVAAPPPKQNVAPGIKEQVTLRIDQDVLEFFQEGGPAGRTASTKRSARPRESRHPAADGSGRRDQSTCDRNRCVRSSLAAVNKMSGGPCSTITPRSVK